MESNSSAFLGKRCPSGSQLKKVYSFNKPILFLLRRSFRGVSSALGCFSFQKRYAFGCLSLKGKGNDFFQKTTNAHFFFPKDKFASVGNGFSSASFWLPPTDDACTTSCFFLSPCGDSFSTASFFLSSAGDGFTTWCRKGCSRRRQNFTRCRKVRAA